MKYPQPATGLPTASTFSTAEFGKDPTMRSNDDPSERLDLLSYKTFLQSILPSIDNEAFVYTKGLRMDRL